eukprot:4549166-Amphidinium_carterae.2
MNGTHTNGHADSMQDETLAPERRLTTLKDFTRLAWEECRKPLGESTGSAEVRFDIYSTWTLLLCLQHAETESERCKSVWKPVPWRTEVRLEVLRSKDCWKRTHCGQDDLLKNLQKRL